MKNDKTHFLFKIKLFSGIKQLLLIAILEFAEVCLLTLNIPQATKLLSESEQLVDMVYLLNRCLYTSLKKSIESFNISLIFRSTTRL